MQTEHPEPRAMFQKNLLTLGLMAIIIIGAYLRSTATIGTVVDHPIRADAADYFMYAYNMIHHGVYSRDKNGYNNPQANPSPDAIRTPGYPFFLMPFAQSGLTQFTTVNIAWAQAFLGILTVLLTFSISRKFLPEWGALGAGLLTAISPHLISSGTYVLSETWFTFLLSASILAILTAIEKPANKWLWLISGIILGTAILTRSGIQYFPLILIPLLWIKLEKKQRLSAIILLAIGIASTTTPWTMRNESSIGKSSDPSLMINFLHHGMYPDFMYQGNPQTLGFPYRFDPRAPEFNTSVSNVLREIESRFRENPGEYLKWYILGKPATLWSWNIIAGAGDVFIYPIKKTPYSSNPLFIYTHEAMRFSHIPVLLLGLSGVILVWIPGYNKKMNNFQRISMQTCSLLLIYYTAIHMIGAPFPRYSIPMLPFIFIMAWIPITALRYSRTMDAGKNRNQKDTQENGLGSRSFMIPAEQQARKEATSM